MRENLNIRYFKWGLFTVHLNNKSQFIFVKNSYNDRGKKNIKVENFRSA